MDLDRRQFVALVVGAAASAAALRVAAAQSDHLPSWAEGPARKAILDFVKTTTDASGPKFVPPEERIACFDQDGTLWVEQPVYTQIVYCFDRVPDLVKAKPALADEEPFKTVLSGDRARIARLSMDDLIRIVGATLTGMDVETFREEVAKWIAKARDPRWKRRYTDLVYLPQIELLRYLRANGYRTFIVTGGGQDFVRVYADAVYDIPPEQIVGTAGAVKYEYDAEGKPMLIKEPKLLLNDDKAGKPEGIHLMIGRRPRFCFGNSSGDREMCEYTTAGDGARLAMLLLHDDGDREYAYGPAQGLPDSKIGTFPETLFDEAQKKGWIVVSMKKDWNRVFAWAN
jgi:phosphoglycolate phosphatase-like HAD superfamily hydrolase